MEDTLKNDTTPGEPSGGSPRSGEKEEDQARASDEAAAKSAELEKTVGILKDQLLRKAAEFENYKKRIETEYGERIRMANEDLLFELLPVIDDFERSLKMASSVKESEGLLRGVELIYQKLMKVLESQGLKHYEVSGKPFDTDYHDALLLVPRADCPPHTVIEEIEKGYMLSGRVLRHAKVVVSCEIKAGETQSPGDEGSGEQITGGAPEA